MHAESSIGRPATASIVVVGLWIVQVLLAAVFLFSGAFKLITPIEDMPLPFPLPGVFIRFIGVCEVLGALGLVLPGLVRIRPDLTPLAAGGLVVLMFGAVMFTPPDALALAVGPVVVGLLAAIVAYGRWRVAPL
jgi:membrane protease YdiL (CAAX protease family)